MLISQRRIERRQHACTDAVSAFLESWERRVFRAESFDVGISAGAWFRNQRLQRYDSRRCWNESRLRCPLSIPFSVHLLDVFDVERVASCSDCIAKQPADHLAVISHGVDRVHDFCDWGAVNQQHLIDLATGRDSAGNCRALLVTT